MSFVQLSNLFIRFFVLFTHVVLLYPKGGTDHRGVRGRKPGKPYKHVNVGDFRWSTSVGPIFEHSCHKLLSFCGIRDVKAKCSSNIENVCANPKRLAEWHLLSTSGSYFIMYFIIRFSNFLPTFSTFLYVSPTFLEPSSNLLQLPRTF